MGDTWSYLQLAWGGILGAQFGMQTGVKLALASTLAGFLFILPLVWYRFHRQSISIGPFRVLFYLGAILLVSAALALQLVE
jgi:hypothetical protein